MDVYGLQILDATLEATQRRRTRWLAKLHFGAFGGSSAAVGGHAPVQHASGPLRDLRNGPAGGSLASQARPRWTGSQQRKLHQRVHYGVDASDAVSCAAFTATGTVAGHVLAEHHRRGQRGPVELCHRNHRQHTYHQQHGQRRELHHGNVSATAAASRPPGAHATLIVAGRPPRARWTARGAVPGRSEVEALVYLAPCQAQQGAQEDRVLSRSGAGLQRAQRRRRHAPPGPDTDGEVVFQLFRAEEGRVKHSDVPQEPEFTSHVLQLHASLLVSGGRSCAAGYGARAWTSAPPRRAARCFPRPGRRRERDG